MKTLVRSAFWLTISEIIFTLSGYIIHSLSGRILGPADYGRFGLVVTLTTMIIILVGNGIPMAMSKYLSEVFETEPDLVPVIKKQALILQTAIISTLTLVFFLCAPLLAFLLKDPTLTSLFRLSAFIIPAFAAASFYFYYYTGIHQFNLQSILKTTRSVARIFFIISLAYSVGLKGAISGYILAPTLIFLIAWIIDIFWISKKFPKKTTQTFEWKKILTYAWPLTLFLLFYELLISLDLYLVKALIGNDYLTGIYNAALTVGRLPYYLFYALTIILLPTISKTTSQKNEAKTGHIIYHSLRIMVLLLVPVVVLMYTYAPEIISIFYGNKYLPAVVPMQILVFGVGFLTVFYVMSFVLNGANLVKIPMYIALAGMVANALLNYFLIPQYGLNGSASATSITSFFITIIMLYYVHKHFKVKLEIIMFLKMLLAGLLIFFISKMLVVTNKWLCLPYGLLLSSVYIFLIYLFKEIKPEDVQLFNSFAKKKA